MVITASAAQGGLVDGTNAATLTRTESGTIVPLRAGMPSGWPGVGGGALIAGILNLLGPAAISYGQLTWSTVLRADIQGFTPTSLYLSSYPFDEMSRIA